MRVSVLFRLIVYMAHRRSLLGSRSHERHRG